MKNHTLVFGALLPSPKQMIGVDCCPPRPGVCRQNDTEHWGDKRVGTGRTRSQDMRKHSVFPFLLNISLFQFLIRVLGLFSKGRHRQHRAVRADQIGISCPILKDSNHNLHLCYRPAARLVHLCHVK